MIAQDKVDGDAEIPFHLAEVKDKGIGFAGVSAEEDGVGVLVTNRSVKLDSAGKRDEVEVDVS